MPDKRSGAAAPTRRVALVVESSGASGCEILRGIARYARQHGPWSFYHEPGHWPSASRVPARGGPGGDPLAEILQTLSEKFLVP